jgi:uncharacterized protein (TIGR03084 family)
MLNDERRPEFGEKGEQRHMLDQALDFRAESDTVFELLDSLEEADWSRPTQFKDWTINDVLAHLHLGNYLADLSLQDSQAFLDFIQTFGRASKKGTSRLSATHDWLDGLHNRALLQRWREFYTEMSDRFAGADPKMRVKWVGPDMSVRSSISARLMETWAHAQAVYDVLGKERSATDRLKNVAVIGINTFGWTFRNRGLPVPSDPPYVRLSAPSGEMWEWNPAQDKNTIQGQAVEFCQVVTQVRNIADTILQVRGETATSWMSIAQCFAGPPSMPPVPGTRFRQVGHA